jgi:hypothetical protein
MMSTNEFPTGGSDSTSLEGVECPDGLKFPADGEMGFILDKPTGKILILQRPSRSETEGLEFPS